MQLESPRKDMYDPKRPNSLPFHHPGIIQVAIAQSCVIVKNRNNKASNSLQLLSTISYRNRNHIYTILQSIHLWQWEYITDRVWNTYIHSVLRMVSMFEATHASPLSSASLTITTPVIKQRRATDKIGITTLKIVPAFTQDVILGVTSASAKNVRTAGSWPAIRNKNKNGSLFARHDISCRIEHLFPAYRTKTFLIRAS